LFGVTATDPATVAAAALILAAGALAAAFIPAWRASNVSPSDALRLE
jgi:ABC-type lipoprotein release transport system permease subunit